MSVTFKSNEKAARAQFERNVARCLEMLGMKWQEIVTMEINTQPRFGPGGGTGIVDTGALRASMNYQADPPNREISVGSPINYAPFVFLGTWKMPARPALQNSVLRYTDDYQAVVQAAMGEGFN